MTPPDELQTRPVPPGVPVASTRPASAPGRIVLAAAAALAVSMGIGRFAYTPILPLMHAQAGLSAAAGSTLATANYAGYLAGALLAIFVPRLARSVLALRASLIVLVATLALMAASRAGPVWFTLRLAAGVASALVFVIAVTTMLTGLARERQHLAGWGFGGIGGGIALSGAVVLIGSSMETWRAAWLTCAALAAGLSAAAWWLRPGPADAPTARQRHGTAPRTHRWFAALLTSYFLEGTGYIIAGTFLVAAIAEASPGAAGASAWILVGLGALPAAALWTRLSTRWSRPALLLAALVIQAAGLALPALAGGVAAALVCAVLFGATFIGVAALVLAIGEHLRFPRAVAILTTGYGVGQILGPLVVTPLLRTGYHSALLVATAIVLAAAVAAAALRVRFPHQIADQAE